MKVAHKKRKYTPPETPQAQANIQFLISGDKIAMQFPSPVRNATFSKEQALTLADIFVKLVGQMEDQKQNTNEQRS